MPRTQPPPSSVEDKLDEIVEHLRRMDKRDRVRMYGNIVHGILGIIPAIAFIASIWYLYMHGSELMATIAREAAIQAAEATKEGSVNFFDQFRNFQAR